MSSVLGVCGIASGRRAYLLIYRKTGKASSTQVGGKPVNQELQTIGVARLQEGCHPQSCSRQISSSISY